MFEGREDEVIKIYRSIYDQGVEPKTFLNDFLEILYYFKNIKFLKLEATNFSLNDEEFKKIDLLAKEVDPQILILFWQFTIKTLDELEIVSNQNLSIEMFLIRLLYLLNVPKKNISLNFEKKEDLNLSKINKNQELKVNQINENIELKNKTVSQIKNISQEETTRPKNHINEKKRLTEINNFDELINICNQKKEIKLKYELETNVNLVNFGQKRIEISFNENLDKDFVKNLSTKLFDWTNQRWIITLSKKNGEPTSKQKNQLHKSKLLMEAKKSEIYTQMIEKFPDAELINIETEEDN